MLRIAAFRTRFLKLFLHRVKAGKPFPQPHLVEFRRCRLLQSIEAGGCLLRRGIT
jgi:hypothetical protein